MGFKNQKSKWNGEKIGQNKNKLNCSKLPEIAKKFAINKKLLIQVK